VITSCTSTIRQNQNKELINHQASKPSSTVSERAKGSTQDFPVPAGTSLASGFASEPSKIKNENVQRTPFNQPVQNHPKSSTVGCVRGALPSSLYERHRTPRHRKATLPSNVCNQHKK